MWVRGLKLVYLGTHDIKLLSHPMWVRGLKHPLNILNLNGYIVAPYVGAWIETIITILNFQLVRSRTLCGCVD